MDDKLTKEELDKILDKSFPLSTLPIPEELFGVPTPKEMRTRVGYIPLSNYEPRIDEQGKKHCLNCDVILTGRRRRYCSDKCSYDFYVKNNWGAIRDKAVAKSNFTCVKCGFHLEKTDKPHYHSNGYKSGFYYYRIAAPDGHPLLGRETTEPSKFFIGDHILPICLGGEEFDESNVQILCVECSKEKTKRDMEKFRIKEHECMLGPEWAIFWHKIIDQKSLDVYS